MNLCVRFMMLVLAFSCSCPSMGVIAQSIGTARVYSFSEIQQFSTKLYADIQ